MGPLIDASSGIAGIASLAVSPTGADAAERLRGRSPEEAAREFEVLLLAQLIGAMRKTVTSSESGLLSASPERKILDGAFDHEIARTLVDRAGLGLAGQIASRLEADHAAKGAPASAVAGPGEAHAAERGRAAQVYRRSAESISNDRS